MPLYGRIGENLRGIETCPHCGIAHPSLAFVWASGLLPRATPGHQYKWAIYYCTACGSGLLAQGEAGGNTTNEQIIDVVPRSKIAHDDIPEPARRFLQQAYQTLHAPDAAGVMAGSAVDAMLKMIGYSDGSVYTRIEAAVADHKLTESMGAWAHEVRLGANRPRHADADKPHLTPAEAQQSVEFAEALGNFLFVLTKRIERGTEAARQSSTNPQ
jgi:hypothetical protein